MLVNYLAEILNSHHGFLQPIVEITTDYWFIPIYLPYLFIPLLDLLDEQVLLKQVHFN
jgi:hypothetical protein